MGYAINSNKGWRAVDSEDDCTDDEIYSENQPLPEPPTNEEQFEAVRNALQIAIDTKARELGFSGGNALMLYVGFENSFQSVAQVFAAWEVSVWVEAGAYKAQVIAGTAPMLTPEEAVAQMPELVMP